MVYNRAFYRVLCWMPFARGMADFFRHPVLQALCTFFDAEELGTDYIHEQQQKGAPRSDAGTGKSSAADQVPEGRGLWKEQGAGTTEV